MPRVTYKWKSFLEFINFEHFATHINFLEFINFEHFVTHVKQLGLVAIGDT